MAWMDKLLKQTVDLKGSDLHISSAKPPMVRVHGAMKTLEGEAALEAEKLRAHLKEICPADAWEEFVKTHDSDFAYALPGVRFRANFFEDRDGPGAVFRVIPSKVPTAEELGLPAAVLNLCTLKKGLVLVTGPTGSGKSTTLAAMINHILQHRDEHIITIEDPIEFVYPQGKCLINQREVKRHTDSFKRALRAALREDPDIVLVGEMRDLETVEIAIETAETGHLVFGTLHTTTASSTVTRVVDQFPADRQAQIRTMLGSSLKGVIAQTLCRKKGEGRVAAMEIMIATPAVAANIKEGKLHSINNAIQIGKNDGMQTLNDALFLLVQTGRIEPEEAMKCSVDREEMRRKLTSSGVAVSETIS